MVKAKDIRLKKDYLDCIFERFYSKAKDIIEIKPYREENTPLLFGWRSYIEEPGRRSALIDIAQGWIPKSTWPIPKGPTRNELIKLANDFIEQQDELSDLIHEYDTQFTTFLLSDNIDYIRKDLNTKNKQFIACIKYLELDK